ncbi:MAG: DUF2119 domain-containing protein [Methanosarcinaceae archaeon]|nr:DUF2119 domain-containing protein [Methanosarcinaceae archaeon]MDF1534737.1 DUF2119 domain-containing protein [Methanosarcinaceae archaeon]
MGKNDIFNCNNTSNDLKICGSGLPIYLFVAGLHGDEWRQTSELLLNINPPENGTLAVIPIVNDGEYISTLDDQYYTTLGSKIIDAVESLHPDVYVELHSYSAYNFAKLTDGERINKTGVPAYIELRDGVLLGSVAPYIRLNHFSMDALCISFEIQKDSERSIHFAEELLDVVKNCIKRDDFVEYLEKMFPSQAKRAIENYKKFYGL